MHVQPNPSIGKTFSSQFFHIDWQITQSIPIDHVEA